MTNLFSGISTQNHKNKKSSMSQYARPFNYGNIASRKTFQYTTSQFNH